MNYPQALLKQAERGPGFPKFAEYDMVIQFSLYSEWYFNDGESEITSKLVDFELVAIHEITHGLGFQSGLYNYQNDLNRPIPYLATYIGQTTSKRRLFYPIGPFESLIPRFSELIGIISDFKPAGSNAQECLHSLESNQTVLQAAQELYRLATSESLSIPLGNNDLFPLHSPKLFDRSTSLTHAHISMRDKVDFIMVPAAIYGLSIDYALNKLPSIYGPATTEIFKMLGYSTKDKIQTLKLQHSDLYFT